MFESIAMKAPHLFEFMDLDWLPVSLRNTLREILECGNARPFRPYYDWAANVIAEEAKESGVKHVVELGAGTAPLGRRLARNESLTTQIFICDRNPDLDVYRELARCYPSKIKAIEEPVDFSEPGTWPEGTLLALSGTLHHLPPEPRRQALRAMAQSADRVLVVEPLRKTPLSMAFVVFSLVPAILLPLWFIGRPGRIRRLVWCWVLPAAPLIFLWDGWISCIREWSDEEFRDEVAKIPGITCKASHTLFCQSILLAKKDGLPSSGG